MREAIRMVVTLVVVCTVAGLALAGVHATTAPIIAEQEARQLTEGLAAVMPGAAKFDPVDPGDLDEAAGPAVKNVWKAEGKGWVVEATPTGYGGGIRMLIGITDGLQVAGMQILAAPGETPGLGTKATEPKFIKQFDGLKPGIALVKNKLPSGNEIQAVTGATITSKAVHDGVNQALQTVQKLSGMR